jgi:hypothetical protein
MGRKGVSKRKPKQTKSNFQSNGTGSGSVSSMMQGMDNQPGKSVDSGKTAPSTRGDAKSSSDWNRKSNKA